MNKEVVNELLNKEKCVVKVCSERIHELRVSNKFSLNEVASELGRTKQWMNSVEKGNYKAMKYYLVQKLAYKFRCTEDYLLGYSNDSNKNSSGFIKPISFGPKGDLQYKISQTVFDNYDFASTFLLCNDLLNSKKLNELTNIMRTALNEQLHLGIAYSTQDYEVIEGYIPWFFKIGDIKKDFIDILKKSYEGDSLLCYIRAKIIDICIDEKDINHKNISFIV